VRLTGAQLARSIVSCVVLQGLTVYLTLLTAERHYLPGETVACCLAVLYSLKLLTVLHDWREPGSSLRRLREYIKRSNGL
jgi:hypothetical protein